MPTWAYVPPAMVLAPALDRLFHSQERPAPSNTTTPGRPQAPCTHRAGGSPPVPDLLPGLQGPPRRARVSRGGQGRQPSPGGRRWAYLVVRAALAVALQEQRDRSESELHQPVSPAQGMVAARLQGHGGADLAAARRGRCQQALVVGVVRRNLGQGPALHQTDLDHSPPGCDGQGGTARPTHQRWGQDRPCSLRGALTGQTLKAGRPRRPPSQASQSLPHTRKEGSLWPRTALLSPVTPRGD